MMPETQLDRDAEKWFNEHLERLRFGQDYDIFPGDSEPMMDGDKQIGIKVQRPYVMIFSTGMVKLYEMIKLGKEYPVVEYTEAEEAEFERKWNEKYGEDPAE